MTLKEIIPADARDFYSLIKQLRPHLTIEDFEFHFLKAKETSNYKLVGAFEENRCLGLMGYRILYDFVHFKHVYIDDLVVDENIRSKGVGAFLLEQAKEIARANGCERLRLCTGNDNSRGMQFYEKNGWQQRAVVYKTKLSSPALTAN